jgi:uncharacterized protein YbjT (DUF2867 family)
MTETTSHRPTLVLGGTGKTGRRVVERITRQDRPVRVGSRSAGLPFDWDDPATWEPALQGVGAVYVSHYADALPGASDAVASFAEVALRSGVRRMVLLSGRGDDEAQACEKRLIESGADWTVLQASWFNQNFDESYLLDPILAGEVALPVGDVGEPFTDADDIAEVATAVLTQDGHVGQTYVLTGPRLLTFSEAVATIADATGRDIRFTRITPADFAAGLTAEGVPGEVVDLLLHLFDTVLDGRNADLGDGIERVLDRPPREFADYAHAVATTGVWTRTDEPNPASPR